MASCDLACFPTRTTTLGGTTVTRKDSTLPDDKYLEPEEYYAVLRQGFREKANHNKIESQWCFTIAITCTLAAPLFVTLGHGDFWGKAVPACLSVLAAGLTSWLQLRKPQRLWSIYRRAQRELEREKSHYDYGLGEYGTVKDRGRLLALRASDLAFKIHEQWEGLVPEPEALVSIKAKNLTGHQDG